MSRKVLVTGSDSVSEAVKKIGKRYVWLSGVWALWCLYFTYYDCTMSISMLTDQSKGTSNTALTYLLWVLVNIFAVATFYAFIREGTALVRRVKSFRSGS